jgi:hypothetical protein
MVEFNPKNSVTSQQAIEFKFDEGRGLVMPFIS